MAKKTPKPAEPATVDERLAALEKKVAKLQKAVAGTNHPETPGDPYRHKHTED